jgi:peptide/nickel transport system substrate-binding protein
VQELFVDAAPWLFLVNPGYQLATRANIKGYAWYTPNANDWADFYKQ